MEKLPEYPFNPAAEIFRWGPVQMQAYRPFDFVPAIFLRFPGVYKGESWPRALFLARGKSMVFMNELAAVQKHGKSVFMKYMLPREARAHAYAQWQRDLYILQEAQKRIDGTNLSSLSRDEFRQEFEGFHSVVEQFWIHVIIPELANYGSVELLNDRLQIRISDEAERAVAMEILTAPEAPSFFQEEEIALSQTDDLEKHQREYFWLRNSYANVEVLPVEYFAKRKKELPNDIALCHQNRREDIRRRREESIARHHVPEEIVSIARAFVAGIEWQDARKKDIWIYLHYKELFIQEAAERLEVTKEDLLNFTAREIVKMFSKGVDRDLVVERRSAFGFLADVGSITPLDRSATLQYWSAYAEEALPSQRDAFKGIVVSRGKGLIQGNVHIVLDPYQCHDFREGDVLVAPMTSPEYIFAMKKASAIITDTGGLMSHAAIVSRELGIPCIVGTKYATKILKDGDRVSVDAEKGIVHIL